MERLGLVMKSTGYLRIFIPIFDSNHTEFVSKRLA